jgi:hypothetical protein
MRSTPVPVDGCLGEVTAIGSIDRSFWNAMTYWLRDA